MKKEYLFKFKKKKQEDKPINPIVQTIVTSLRLHPNLWAFDTYNAYFPNRGETFISIRTREGKEELRIEDPYFIALTSKEKEILWNVIQDICNDSERFNRLYEHFIETARQEQNEIGARFNVPTPARF